MSCPSSISLALSLPLALGACGNEESDSDPNHDSSLAGSGGSTSDGGGGSAGQVNVSSLEGTYVGVYQMAQRHPAAEGWGEIAIDANGHGVIHVAPGDSSLSLAGETDVTPDGEVTFRVAGTATVDYEVTYQGTFRLEGDNAFCWGEWSSSSGATGLWGGYRTSNRYPLDASIPAICSGVIQCNTSDWMATDEDCRAFLPCALGYGAAKGEECYDAMTELAGLYQGIESPNECPNASTVYAPSTCRLDPGVCEYVVKAR